jgi:tetratricopeptide (TPR) repeat protein
VERDPRELRDVGEPLDRLYADLALANVHCGDYESAVVALRQAVRWNPMGCEHRLNLADLCRVAGDMREYLALSFSVFERASEASHLVRAFVNFAEYFVAAEMPRAAAAALRVARRIDPDDRSLAASLEHAAGTEADPDTLTDEEATQALEAEGLPDGANAEVAICLLMCASDAAAMGQRDVATNLTIRARDLVGEKAAKALLSLIHEGDEDDASE